MAWKRAIVAICASSDIRRGTYFETSFSGGYRVGESESDADPAGIALGGGAKETQILRLRYSLSIQVSQRASDRSLAISRR